MAEKKNKNIKEQKKKVKPENMKLKDKIEKLEAELTEAKDKNLRIHAEYDNYRKRSFRELTDARANVKADTLIPVLNVFDHFKMAVDAAESSDDMTTIKEGMKMISAEFTKAMEEYGIEEINALGEKFDPNIHEAVANETSDEIEDTVIKQWRCGYKMGNKLLRPATVVVSSGTEQPEEGE